MNKSLNILGKPDKPSTFLLVWQGDNSEYFCEFIHNKDYETVKLTFYRERDVYFVDYEKEEQVK